MIGWFILLPFFLCIIAAVICGVKAESRSAVKHSRLIQPSVQKLHSLRNASIILFLISWVLFIIFLALFTCDLIRKTTTRLEEQSQCVESLPLIAMKSDSAIFGGTADAPISFYGYISEDNICNFLYKASDGGCTRKSVDFDLAAIYELEQESTEEIRLERWEKNSYIVKTYDEASLKYFRPFWRDLISAYEERAEYLSSQSTFYKVYIPEGGIISFIDPAN